MTLDIDLTLTPLAMAFVKVDSTMQTATLMEAIAAQEWIRTVLIVVMTMTIISSSLTPLKK